MEITDSADAKGRKPQTGFPRRFGIGSLLVITALSAMLFGSLRTLDAHPAVYVVISGFVVLIGLGQVFLFGGKQPREASLLVGAAIFFLLMTFGVIVMLVEGDVAPPYALLPATISAPAFGAISGYFVGCVIGGVFLVGDWINRKMERGNE